jgi:hypothetical protein
MINHALVLGPIEIFGRNSDIDWGSAPKLGLLKAILRLDL